MSEKLPFFKSEIKNRNSLGLILPRTFFTTTNYYFFKNKILTIIKFKGALYV